MKKRSTLILLLFIISHIGHSWGFFAHKRINRLAVFTLPQEMIYFYKKNILYLTENAVKPDMRRYGPAGKDEEPRHYIDIDAHVYGDSAIYTMPRQWDDAVAKYSEDTLKTYGIVPWHIEKMYGRLVWAFREKDVYKILKNSAELGHYIADSNVPLHTTENYNGQFTGQKGIHGFWESRLPELLSDDYDFFVGKAEYEDDPLSRAWKGVTRAHLAMDSVLRFERELTLKMGEDKKYSYEDRGGKTTQVYSNEFSTAFHDALNGQVERQMRTSIKMVGDLWYSAWVDAGQPDLDVLAGYTLTEEDIKELEEKEEEELKGKPKFDSKRMHEH